MPPVDEFQEGERLLMYPPGTYQYKMAWEGQRILSRVWAYLSEQTLTKMIGWPAFYEVYDILEVSWAEIESDLETTEQRVLNL